MTPREFRNLTGWAAINLNPYQGLKLFICKIVNAISRRNKPKPLSGIETESRDGDGDGNGAAINLNPYQGLKPKQYTFQDKAMMRRNKPKPLSGIET